MHCWCEYCARMVLTDCLFLYSFFNFFRQEERSISNFFKQDLCRHSLPSCNIADYFLLHFYVTTYSVDADVIASILLEQVQ